MPQLFDWTWAEGDTFEIQIDNRSGEKRVVRKRDDHLYACAEDGRFVCRVEDYVSFVNEGGTVTNLKHAAKREVQWATVYEGQVACLWHKMADPNYDIVLPTLLEAEKQGRDVYITVTEDSHTYAYRLKPLKPQIDRTQHLVARANAGLLTYAEQAELAALINK